MKVGFGCCRVRLCAAGTQLVAGRLAQPRVAAVAGCLKFSASSIHPPNIQHKIQPVHVAEYDDRIKAAIAAAEAAGVKLQPSPEVLELLRSADAFTFDVDSTL